MFRDWDDFYLLIGSAGAALIGLLFVVATLSRSQDQQGAVSASDVFITPVVFHFTVILALSGLALAPGLAPLVAGAGVGAAAACGITYSGLTVGRLRSGKVSAPHWSDVWFYGVAPLVLYLAMGAVAVALTASAVGAAFWMGAVLMLLLMVCIRNAWDLVTYLAPRKDGGEEP